MIAAGRTAEVFEYGPGRVAKVLRPGFGEHLVAIEERALQVLAEEGIPAVRTFGRITHEGRPGLVENRLEGQDMLAALDRRPWRVGELAANLAEVHVEVHRATTDSLPDVREVLAARIDATAGVLGFSEREAAKARLLVLPKGDRLLHGDFHPGNVLMDSDQFVPIDWSEASRGPVEADLVRTLWLLSPPAVPTDMPKRPLALMLVNRFRHRYQATYERLTGHDRRRLAPWRLPVLAARVGDGIDHEQEPLIGAVRALAR